jgi:hypothetical protein
MNTIANRGGRRLGQNSQILGYCLAYAWRGSFTLANAWQGLWGTILLWAFGYWRKIPVTIPDKVDDYALLFLLVSLGATWVGVFLFQFLIAPAKLYWQERDRAASIEAELKAARKEQNADDTKWTISELFQHIDPDYLEHKRWEEIGDQLRDALSAGRLTMWGRLKETDSGPWIGPRAALTPIENTYWYKAYFTYFFFHESTADGVHVFADRKTGRPAYTDLQISRSEALAAWPGEPDDIAESYPNIRVADSPAVIDLFNGKERPKLIALLGSKKLTSWARVSAAISSDHVVLSDDIWHTHSFRFVPKEPDPGTINQTYLRARRESSSSHFDVCLNYAQLKRVWPDLMMRRSKCDVM